MNNYPKRKPTRLKGYDYSSPGAYFITICTKDRKCILSEISPTENLFFEPKNILLYYGSISEKYINRLNSFYTHISVDKYVIMPNHIHIILIIQDDFYTTGTSGTPSPTNSVISKFVSTFKRFCNKEFGENIWQRGSYDHIIRDYKDYEKIWQYIDTNVLRWQQDCFFTKDGE